MGTLILKNIRMRKELWFAAFPLLFAVQQLVEGFLWLVIRNGGVEGLRRQLAFVYLLFAYGLWPILCPVSVYAIEYNEQRKKVLRTFICLGMVTSAYLLFFIFLNPVDVWPREGHLHYSTFVQGSSWFTSVYLACTLLPYFLSSQKAILLFGAPNVFFFGLAFLAYRLSFISVWCFFAALISANLYLSLKKLHHEPLLPKNPAPQTA
jgi:hypothetical protein